MCPKSTLNEIILEIAIDCLYNCIYSKTHDMGENNMKLKRLVAVATMSVLVLTAITGCNSGGSVDRKSVV